MLDRSSTWLRRAGLALAATTLGCSFFMPVDTLRSRAAFDMKCPEAQLQFVEMGGDCGKKLGSDYTCTLGVRGCGAQATYIHVPTADWIMNGASGTP